MLNTTYDITKAFEIIEEELISSMIQNMKRHRIEEINEGYRWEMWQVKQLESLEEYKRKNSKKYQSKFHSIHNDIDNLIRESYRHGGMEEERKILYAIKKGFKHYSTHSSIQAEFFRLNERKLEALINSVQNDMQNAEYSILRKADDQYRKIIFNAQVYANTGVGTYEKAVDMATRDMLASGLQCIQYKNGARHRLPSYVKMALRTATKRAYLQGEGVKRREWGITTVILNKRGNACPLCVPFVGKVFIDDVWSGGSRLDGSYPLMSEAIKQGLYHPNCKDSHTTYFPGISTPCEGWKGEELEEIETTYKQGQHMQYAIRQVERFARLLAFSLYSGNKRKYQARLEEWKVVVNRGETGILEKEHISEVSEVHTVGKIDREIYKCITEDIVTDEVIITDNQIQHVKERHSQDYQVILDKLKNIILNPEYIIRDKKPNTGLVIGNIFENGEAAQIVLRLVTSKDERGYKNSIISYWRISAKRLQNYLRNKQVLYKKE